MGLLNCIRDWKIERWPNGYGWHRSSGSSIGFWLNPCQTSVGGPARKSSIPTLLSERGSPLRPFPTVLLCPRNIPKLQSCMGLVVVWIWASLIIVLLFLGILGVACWVLASNRSANFAACPATRCYKKPELLGRDPLPHPISITDFIHTVISHKKLYGSFGGRGASTAKSPAFCNGRHYGRER